MNISIKNSTTVYEHFKNLSSKYQEKHFETYQLEYNKMIKTKVNEGIMKAVLDDFFRNKKEHNLTEYTKLVNIFDNLKINKSNRSKVFVFTKINTL